MSRASGLRAASVSPVSEKRVVPCLRLREVHLPILLAFACKVTAQLLQRAAHPLLRCLFADAEGGGGFAMAFLIEESKQQGIAVSLAQAFERFINDGRNLLFLTKDERTKEIWYYEHPYPPGVKSYNKTKPIRLEEFDAEKKWWAKPGKRKENEFAWRVSIEDIVARGYNLDVKNPHTVDDAHRDPAELLAEYQKAQAAVAEVREKLRKELETALTR